MNGILLAIVIIILTAKMPAQTLTAELVISPREIPKPQDVVIAQNRIFAVDDLTNRILIFDRTFKQIGSFGHIGSGSGTFFHPAGIAVYEDNLVVMDNLNQLAQRFTFDGHFLNQWVLPDGIVRPIKFAPLSDQLIVNDPASGQAFLRLSMNGARENSFGALLYPSDCSLPATSALSRDVNSLNSGWITTDERGNIFVGYVAVPIIRKYDPSGNVIFSKTIGGSNGEHLMNIAKGIGASDPAMLRIHIGQTGVSEVIRDVAFSPLDKHLWVLDGDGRILVFSEEGDLLHEMSVDAPPLSNGASPIFSGIRATGMGTFLLPIYSGGIYRVRSQ